jgi:hypothetical protein
MLRLGRSRTYDTRFRKWFGLSQLVGKERYKSGQRCEEGIWRHGVDATLFSVVAGCFGAFHSVSQPGDGLGLRRR